MTFFSTNKDEYVSQNDLISINALVEYLAHRKGFPRDNCHYLLQQEFGVPSIAELKRHDLDRAIVFLVDLESARIH